MYTVIVVDDEKSISDRIVGLLSKRSDFSLLGSYSNGYDALMFGVPLEPDLIITDVKMPFIDGLQLIERAKEELPTVQAMVISGFDSFDFAKKAIELGVLGYITKPIDPDEFNAVLDKAIVQLDAYYKVEDKPNPLESLKKEISADIHRLLTFKEPSTQFREKLLAEGVNLDSKSVCVAAFNPDKDEDELTIEEAASLEDEFVSILTEELGDLCHLYHYYDHPYLIALLIFDGPIYKDQLTKAIEPALLRFKKSSSFTISSGISELADLGKPFSYRKLLRHARHALEYRTALGSGVLVFYDDLQKHQSSVGKVDENEYARLTYALLNGKDEEAKQMVGRLIEQISTPSYRDSYFLILNNILDALLRGCVAIDAFYQGYMTHVELTNQIYACRGATQVANRLCSLIDRIASINAERRKGGVDAAYSSIMGYLQSHYREEGLTLSLLCDDLGYSLSYVSAILKRHETSFTKEVSRLRMEEAKKLLSSSDSSLSEIAEQLGYGDPYYFSHCFKRIVGCSPLEYRRNGEAKVA